MKRNGWLVLVILAGGMAHAASFDCAKARTPREKAICASPQLSKADEQMAVAYHTWLAAAAPEWRQGIRTNQREWLDSLRIRCETKDSTSPLALCLGDAYRARIKELREMVQHKGGMTFVWRTIMLTVPDDPGLLSPWAVEMNPGFGTLEASWPQANADSPEWQAWNRAIEQATRASAQNPGNNAATLTEWKATANVDSDTSVALNSVGPQLVTATIQSLWDGHGAHPNHGTTEFNWLLQQKRSLTPDDIFCSGSGWETWIQQHLDAYLHKTLDTQPNDDYRTFFPPGQMVKVLHSIVTNPLSWRLDNSGLTLVFQPYEVACYACTPPPMTIPWSGLKPYLQPGFALPH